jgi:hypothetical protein
LAKLTASIGEVVRQFLPDPLLRQQHRVLPPRHVEASFAPAAVALRLAVLARQLAQLGPQVHVARQRRLAGQLLAGTGFA